MKRLILVLAASIVSFQSFAASDTTAKDQCELKLKKMDRIVSIEGEKVMGAEPAKFYKYKETAEKAHAADDLKQCNASGDQALQLYQKARHK